MIAISDKLRHQVMKLAEQYEKSEFITDDPIEWCEPVRFGKGGSKSGRSEKQIRKDRKRSKARKTHRRKK